MTPPRRILRGRPVRLSAGTDPPAEFRLFPVGEVRTEKGTFYLEPDDAQACLEAQAAYGNDLSIDYGHGAFEEASGTPQPAAGWIGGLELRPDGLWAVGVSWTETAAGMLRRREQRYFSPAFETDEAGHIRKILNVALTLIPATHELTPLVASRRGGRNPVSTRKLNMADKYCKASDIAALADDMEKMGDTFDGAKSMAARLRKLAEDAKDAEEMAEDHPEPDGDEAPKTTADESDDAEKAAEDGDDAEKTADDEEPKQTKRASRADLSLVALAKELTGKSSPSEVAGALRALVSHKKQNAELTSRVKRLEDDLRRRDVEALVQKHSRPNTKDCKLAPSQKSWAVKLGMTDLAQLEAYLKDAPVLAGPASAAPEQEAIGTVIALSAQEKKIAEQMGNDPAKYLEFKKQQARR